MRRFLGRESGGIWYYEYDEAPLPAFLPTPEGTTEDQLQASMHILGL